MLIQQLLMEKVPALISTVKSAFKKRFYKKIKLFLSSQKSFEQFLMGFSQKSSATTFKSLRFSSKKSLIHILSIFILLFLLKVFWWQKQWQWWRRRGSVDSGRRRRVLSNYSALSLYSGNKGKTKPHDASNTREQFESSVGTGCLWQLASQSPQRRRVIAFGKLVPAVVVAELGIKDDCLDLQSKGGKIGNLRLECSCMARH